MPYELFYWPSIQGRGEFVRLTLEEAGADYVDVARERGLGEMSRLMEGEGTVTPPFAPPFLRDGEVVVGQTAVILLYLGGRIGLAPRNEGARLWTHQLQLTIADFVDEAHDLHHPIASSLYYHDQKAEAARRAADFREARIPKFFSWFERVLELNPNGDKHLVGRRTTYADLSLFQVVEGLRYALPKASERALQKSPRVAALHAAVAARPNIRAYLESDRRIAFNEDGIFRRYPELDA